MATLTSSESCRWFCRLVGQPHLRTPETRAPSYAVARKRFRDYLPGRSAAAYG